MHGRSHLRWFVPALAVNHSMADTLGTRSVLLDWHMTHLVNGGVRCLLADAMGVPLPQEGDKGRQAVSGALLSREPRCF